MAKKPKAIATESTTGSDASHPLDAATDADWVAAWRTALAPNETFWRQHANAAAKRKFVEEQAKNAIEIAEKLLAMLGKGDWPTLDECIPKGSILEVVDKFFYSATDLPRELPFYNVIHYVGALLLQQGVQIQKSKTQILYPDFWTLILSDSGGGKTLTLDAIANSMGGTIKMFENADSYAKFFENLQANNKSFYLKDEFAKFIRAISKDPKMEGLQGCLLNVYSNAKISYSTKAGTETINKPALSILGLTQIANITTTITKSMIDDGFAQRFGYVFAEKDGRRRVLNYIFDDLPEQVAPLWKELTSTPFHPVYYVDEVVNEAFEAGGNLIVDRADEKGMTEQFSRRIIFRSFKYALVYHVLNGKTDQYLHAEDMAQGLRLCARELRDTARLLDKFGALNPPLLATKLPNLATLPAGAAGAPSASQTVTPTIANGKLAIVQAYLQKRKAANAPALKLGKLQGNIRALSNADETRTLAAQAIAADPSLAPFVTMT